MHVAGDTHLRIKVKDLYLWIVEPKEIAVTCRKCSFTNALRPVPGPQQDSAP